MDNMDNMDDMDRMDNRARMGRSAIVNKSSLDRTYDFVLDSSFQ